jgi:hypothetical protein
MEQLFWQNNRNVAPMNRGLQIRFEKRDKNKVIYLGGNRK